MIKNSKSNAENVLTEQKLMQKEFPDQHSSDNARQPGQDLDHAPSIGGILPEHEGKATTNDGDACLFAAVRNWILSIHEEVTYCYKDGNKKP